MAKFKDENGNEVEAFTAAEMEARVKEDREKAIEEYKAANPDKTAEITELQTKLAEAEQKAQQNLDDAIAAGGNKEQIERLRKERDDAKVAAAETTTALEKKFEQFKKELMGDTEKEMLAKLSNGDKELEKKLKFEFDNYRPNDISKKGIEERMAVAAQIVTGQKPAPNFMDGSTSAGDRGDTRNQGAGAPKVGENEGKIGNALGVTDKDREAVEAYKKSKNMK